jgi:hypothetical protein
MTELQSAVEKMSNTALTFALYRKRNVAAAMMLSDDSRSRQIVWAIMLFLKSCLESLQGKGPLCLNCDTEFSQGVMPQDFWVVARHLTDWTGATEGQPMLLTGICTKCSRKNDKQLEVIGLKRMRRIWPDLTPVPAGNHDQPSH